MNILPGILKSMFKAFTDGSFNIMHGIIFPCQLIMNELLPARHLTEQSIFSGRSRIIPKGAALFQ